MNEMTITFFGHSEITSDRDNIEKQVSKIFAILLKPIVPAHFYAGTRVHSILFAKNVSTVLNRRMATYKKFI